MKKIFFILLLILSFIFLPCFAQEKHNIVLKKEEPYLILLNDSVLEFLSSDADAFNIDILTTLYNERNQLMIEPQKEGVFRLYLTLKNDDYIVLSIEVNSQKKEKFDIFSSNLIRTILKLDKVNEIKPLKKKYKFETKLLGYANIYNILAGIACGREFGIEISELQAAVKMVKPVEHRLELKKLGSFYQIDDAYNSNPVGAKSACEVLGMMDGVKVVVTPGMIELGDKEKYYNKEFGKQIAKVADYVVLVGEKRTKPIYEGILSEGFDKDNIIVYNDVRDAYTFINSLTNGKDEVFALFENDLPDTYNE